MHNSGGEAGAWQAKEVGHSRVATHGPHGPAIERVRGDVAMPRCNGGARCHVFPHRTGVSFGTGPWVVGGKVANMQATQVRTGVCSSVENVCKAHGGTVTAQSVTHGPINRHDHIMMEGEGWHG